MFRKLLSVLEGVCSWCIGFLLAGFIFAIAILYIVPTATKIPVDTSKYIARAQSRIEENTSPRDLADEEKSVPLSDTVIHAIDKAADNLIHWINE